MFPAQSMLQLSMSVNVDDCSLDHECSQLGVLQAPVDPQPRGAARGAVRICTRNTHVQITHESAATAVTTTNDYHQTCACQLSVMLRRKQSAFLAAWLSMYYSHPLGLNPRFTGTLARFISISLVLQGGDCALVAPPARYCWHPWWRTCSSCTTPS